MLWRGAKRFLHRNMRPEIGSAGVERGKRDRLALVKKEVHMMWVCHWRDSSGKVVT